MGPPLYVAFAVAEDPSVPLVPTSSLRVFALPGFKRDDADEVEQRWVLCQGLEDGSLVVYNLPGDKEGSTEQPVESHAASQTSAERPPVSGIALTTLRSPTLGSPRSDLTPNLSRKSSSTNLQSWSHSEDGFAVGTSPRPRGVSSASTARTAVSAASLDLSREGRSIVPPAATVSKTSATASLTRVKAADDAEMLEHLRAQRAITPSQAEHPGVATKLAGLGRRGIDGDRARSPQAEQRTRDTSADRSGAPARTSKISKLERMLSADYHASDSMVEQIEEEEEGTAHVNDLLPLTSAVTRVCSRQEFVSAVSEPTDGSQCPTVRIILPGMENVPVVAMCQLAGTPRIAVLGKTG